MNPVVADPGAVDEIGSGSTAAIGAQYHTVPAQYRVAVRRKSK